MINAIQLIVGLGNPTETYSATRHNAGYWFVDEVADRYSVAFRHQSQLQGFLAKIAFNGSVYLFKPSTYMNHSGRAVGLISRYYKIPPDQILVVHDELDFDVGVVRLKKDGGHGGHNGLRDIIANLSSKNFCRLRIGIGHPGVSGEVISYVLQKPSVTESQEIHAAISAVIDVIPSLIKGDYQAVMNSLHLK